MKCTGPLSHLCHVLRGITCDGIAHNDIRETAEDYMIRVKMLIRAHESHYPTHVVRTLLPTEREAKMFLHSSFQKNIAEMRKERWS